MYVVVGRGAEEVGDNATICGTVNTIVRPPASVDAATMEAPTSIFLQSEENENLFYKARKMP